jgi:hypothetical protein
VIKNAGILFYLTSILTTKNDEVSYRAAHQIFEGEQQSLDEIVTAILTFSQ